jgi:thioredoxin domain-containing protein 5
MAGTWDNLAQSVGQENGVTIGKVDCTQFRNLCNEFEVKGYPTLLWIKDGKKVSISLIAFSLIHQKPDFFFVIG